jgi:hypothetical protein
MSIFSILDNVWGKITYQPTFGFVRPITDTGSNGPGATFNMNGDYSAAPTDFWIQPPSNEAYYLTRFQFQISISSTPSRLEYGSIPALTNGILVFEEFNGNRHTINPGELPIKDNTDIILLSGSPRKSDFGGVNDIYVFDFELGETQFEGLQLNGSTNDKFGLTLNDDLTGIVDHRLVIKGIFKKVGAA